MTDLSKDITRACELHSELYHYTTGVEHSRMDRWEVELIDERFAFEELISKIMVIIQRAYMVRQDATELSQEA